MRQTVAIASGLTTASIFLLGGVVTLAFAAVLVAISVAWVLSASRHSSVRTASVFAPVAMALAFGFVFDVDSDVSGLAFLALLAAALISATASRQTGFRLKLTETVMLGAVAGVCLVIGSYLAYTFGLGHGWSGEAGRSLKGFLIASGVAGAIFGGLCGLISVALFHYRAPRSGRLTPANS